MWDWSFEFSDPINKYLMNNLDFKNKYIIYASFLMDAMLLTFFSLFLLYWRTYRVIFALVIFFISRAFIQKTFLMGRPEGFMWSYPGMYALTVPYPDVNDFYFSGHVGTCTLVLLEYRANKWFKMSYITTFILTN